MEVVAQKEVIAHEFFASLTGFPKFHTQQQWVLAPE